MVNRENVLRVADAIENIKPGDSIGFNMRDFYAIGSYDRSGHNCDTTCCIGGWIDVLFKEEEKDEFGDVADRGTVLGLSNREAKSLFYSKYFATSDQAVKALRELADTGEVPEWWRHA